MSDEKLNHISHRNICQVIKLIKSTKPQHRRVSNLATSKISDLTPKLVSSRVRPWLSYG